MTVIADRLEPVEARGAESTLPPGLVLDIEQVPLGEWDGVAAGFDELCQEQLLAFAGMRWPGTTPEAWVFRRGGMVVGGTLVVVKSLPLGVGGIAINKWGPMLAEAAREDADQLYAGMVEALIAEYATRRGMLLSILDRAATAPQQSRIGWLGRRGFRPGVLLNYPLRYIVRLGLDDAALRAGLEQKWRYQLGKSLKHDLTFEHAGGERLAEFTALYEKMLDRKRFADYSAYATIPHLMRLENEQTRPELFFVKKDDRVVAGAIIFKGGDRAVYLYGATLDEALPLRAGYFLHWSIMRWLRDNTRAEWYDLGGSDGFLGLHQFKKGMVGSTGVITPVPRVMNYAERPLAWLLGCGGLWAREAFHEVLRRLGRLRRDRAQPTMPRHIETVADKRL